MSAFTPGPWRVFSARSIRSRNPQHKGCEVAHTTYGWGDERRMANARLIAAAPELYDGCNAMLGLVQLLLGRDDLPAEVREVLTTNHRIAEAEAAVAKADAQ